jgi:hypothetical protein
MTEIVIVGGGAAAERPKLEQRHLEELSAEESKAAQVEANREAIARYGRDARAAISPDVHEHARGEGATVGILRIVRRERAGFRPHDAKVFAVLGRGASWAAAFADAEAFQKKIEERLGDKGIAAANATYARRISTLHR